MKRIGNRKSKEPKSDGVKNCTVLVKKRGLWYEKNIKKVKQKKFSNFLSKIQKFFH